MKQADQQGKVYSIAFHGWLSSISSLLDSAGLPEKLAFEKMVIIKPNLVEPLLPPITTPVACIAGLVEYLKTRVPHIAIIVAEGTGSKDNNTHTVFEYLGYTAWAWEADVKLVDLNTEPLVKRERTECRRWPQMYLPEIIFEGFLLSVPVLKAHSLADVTLTMKNMMGLAPPAHYQQGGHWKKAAFHNRVHEAVYDLNRYRAPDFTLLDATVGMQEAHLWGPECNPPHNTLLAGYDPVAIDAYGAGMLGLDWRKIGHIRMAHQDIGWAEPLHHEEITE